MIHVRLLTRLPAPDGDHGRGTEDSGRPRYIEHSNAQCGAVQSSKRLEGGWMTWSHSCSCSDFRAAVAHATREEKHCLILCTSIVPERRT